MGGTGIGQEKKFIISLFDKRSFNENISPGATQFNITTLVWEKKKSASSSIVAGSELPHDYSSLKKMWNTPGGLMEVKCISSSMSVRGCVNQRQSNIWPLSDRLMKYALLSVAEVRLRSAVWSKATLTTLYRCHRLSSESKGGFKFPWLLNALGGQTHQISEQYWVKSLPCNRWHFFSALHTWSWT